MLAAAIYLVTTLGPHAVELARQIRDADRHWSRRHGDHVATTRVPDREFTQLLADYERNAASRCRCCPSTTSRTGSPHGWAADDPLTPIALGLLARQAGFTQFWRQWIPHLRGRLEATPGRRRRGEALRPRRRPGRPSRRRRAPSAWTLPLHRLQAVALVGIVRTAAIITARRRLRDAVQRADGTARRLPPPTRALRSRAWPATGWPARSSRASRWAASPTNGSSSSPPTARSNCSSNCTTTRETERPCSAGSPSTSATSGSATGSTAPPGSGSGSPRSPTARSTCGRCAARWRSSWPTGPAGCSPRRCTSNTSPWPRRRAMPRAPAAPKPNCSPRSTSTRPNATWTLVWTEFRNYQQGILPAGPGARELTEFFAHIDGKLATLDAGAAKIQRKRPRRAQPADQTRPDPAPRDGELLLVHRPVPGVLPQTRRNPARRPAADRDV